MIKYTLITLMVVMTHSSYSQYFLDSRVNTLTVQENESLTFMGDTLVIDSLVMEDNSSLLFQKNALVIVKNSFIGNSVVISSAGSDGKDGGNSFFTFSHATDGEDGLPGNDLTLFINFNELGSLNITSQGGNGGNGGNGYYEGNSGNGGIGGAGGKLSVYYNYHNFVPEFNRPIPGPHSVLLTSNAGNCGNTGRSRYNYKKQAWIPTSANSNTRNVRDNTRIRGRFSKRVPGWYSATSNRYKTGRDQPQTNECYSDEDGEIILKRVINQ